MQEGISKVAGQRTNPEDSTRYEDSKYQVGGHSSKSGSRWVVELGGGAALIFGCLAMRVLSAKWEGGVEAWMFTSDRGVNP